MKYLNEDQIRSIEQGLKERIDLLESINEMSTEKNDYKEIDMILNLLDLIQEPKDIIIS
jgi:hypothetical protein